MGAKDGKLPDGVWGLFSRDPHTGDHSPAILTESNKWEHASCVSSCGYYHYTTLQTCHVRPSCSPGPPRLWGPRSRSSSELPSLAPNRRGETPDGKSRCGATHQQAVRSCSCSCSTVLRNFVLDHLMASRCKRRRGAVVTDADAVRRRRLH